MIMVVRLTSGRAGLRPWLDANCFMAGLSVDYRPVYHVTEAQAGALIGQAQATLEWDEAGHLIESIQRQYDALMTEGA